MFNKKECVAMLLAGGQGSRLYALTQDVAKPAVPFGAKYRAGFGIVFLLFFEEFILKAVTRLQVLLTLFV